MKSKGIHRTGTISMGVAAMLIVIAASCYNTNSIGFNGSRVKNDGLFAVDSTMMNMTESHRIMMETGDDFQVEYNVESGRMDVLIKSPSGATSYRGDGIGTAKFRVTARETGYYEIELDAKKFKGSVSFTRIHNTTNDNLV